ncbi:MAG TPA: ABC transporter permease [Terracidiphilus sp.]|nr:ABC transporter permease [Terracidiphilus sp.]
MRTIRALWHRVHALIYARRGERDFDRELASHIEMHTEDGMRAGLSREEARRRAMVRLGGAEQTRQAHRERRTLTWLEIALQDVRYAMRGFRLNPVFAATAIVTLALGIGAATAVFSAVNRILFRALPYANPDRLVSVGLTAPIIPQEFMLGGSYYDWRDHQKPFSALTSETGVNGCDLTERNPAHLACASVEASFLPTLGVSPIRGRNFLPEEDRPHGAKVALLSYSLWAGHYGRDPSVVDRTIDLDGSPVRVIGILPPDFEMPSLEPADLLVPEALDEAAERKADPGRVLYAYARLKPGISVPQAVAQLQPVFNYSLSLAPPRFRSEVHLRVRSLRDRQMQGARLSAWILLGAVFALLLIACANVAGLQLTRAAAREREHAVRAALGASRGRLVCQSLTESALLAFFGMIAGWALATALLRIFIRLAPSSLPFLGQARLDLRILLFTFALAFFSGFLFGLASALRKPRPVALTARTAVTSARGRLRRFMVAAQIAASVVLLAGAALLVRSFVNLQSQPLGIDSHGVLTAGISLNRYRFPSAQARMQFFLQAETALRRVPGVSQVALSDSLPPGGYSHQQIFGVMQVAGRPPLSGGTGGMVAWRWVTPSYFSALDIPILRGRPFTNEQRTSTAHPLILSSLLAARLFPGQDPIGQQVRPVPDGPWYVVQGVAADVKNGGLTGDEEPEYYLLRRNLVDDWQSYPSASFILRSDLPPKAISPWIQSQIAAIDPTVPVEIEKLSGRIGSFAARPRFETALLSFFAFIGLAMAAIGLYGVLAYVTAQRTQEIGVRMALGASRASVLRLVIGDGMRLVLSGGVIGLAAALFVTRILKSLLFSVAPRDPLSFIAVSLLLAFVSLIATVLPARRAAAVDPGQALRAE